MSILMVLSFFSTVFAYEPNPEEWTWRVSSDEDSIYSYNAPPELLKIDAERNYVEFTGHVLVVYPYDPKVERYQMKIRVGIKIKERQMWISYLQQAAYDKNGKLVPIAPQPKTDAWHSVLHNTSEEWYGLALFRTFMEYSDAGAYSKKKKQP